MDELADALGDLEGTLKQGDGPVRLNDDGELVISPLTAEDIAAEAEELHGELERMLPNVPIASLLVKMDRHTGFPDCFTHAGGKQARSQQLKRNLIAVHESGVAQYGRLLRHLVRRAGVARGVVHPRGDAAGGEYLPGQLPPPAAHDEHVRFGHAVVRGRAAPPGPGASRSPRGT
nr:hypothetical protein [Streptomyces sp. NEAU-383]